MKNLLLLAAIVAPSLLFSQHVTESPMTYKKRLSSLFSGESSIIMMSLQKDYVVGGIDTTYACQIAVTETDVDISNFSIGFTSFAAGSLLGAATSASMSVQAESKTSLVFLDKPKFMEFYECVNSVYKVSGMMAFSKKQVNAICSCGVEEITFVGEYAPEAMNKQRFYFELGEAVFSMTRQEFEEVVKFVVDVRKALEAK